MNRVRAFIRENPAVCLSTHTPLGVENLDAKKVVDLDHPPASIPPGVVTGGQATGKYICSICGTVYDPVKGHPDRGIPAGTRFEDLPDDWHCPKCRQGKSVLIKRKLALSFCGAAPPSGHPAGALLLPAKKKCGIDDHEYRPGVMHQRPDYGIQYPTNGQRDGYKV